MKVHAAMILDRDGPMWYVDNLKPGSLQHVPRGTDDMSGALALNRVTLCGMCCIYYRQVKLCGCGVYLISGPDKSCTV